MFITALQNYKFLNFLKKSQVGKGFRDIGPQLYEICLQSTFGRIRIVSIATFLPRLGFEWDSRILSLNKI